MRNPKEPPDRPAAPPLEPFRLLRIPPEGTPLLGLPRPLRRLAAAPPLPAAPPVAGAPPGAAGAPAPAPGELERHLDGLRVELVYFRNWLPAQVAQLAAGRRRRALALAAAEIALGLLLSVASGAAAVRWPAYGRLVTRAAHLNAPPAASATR